MTAASRIELTVRLWATSSPRFEEYLEALVQLLPRHQGKLVRRVEPLDGRPGEPDVVLVMSFPNAVAIDSFLRDPARSEMENLAEEAVVRSLISDGRTRTEPDEPATLHALRRNDG